MTRRNGIGCCGQQFPLICCLSKHKQESGSAQTGVTFKSAEHRHEGNSVISPVTEGAHIIRVKPPVFESHCSKAGLIFIIADGRGYSL
jgi:hypothetical protein